MEETQQGKIERLAVKILKGTVNCPDTVAGDRWSGSVSNKTVRGVAAKAVQCDEIWSLSGAKNKRARAFLAYMYTDIRKCVW
jgi:hypothetical protein